MCLSTAHVLHWKPDPLFSLVITDLSRGEPGSDRGSGEASSVALLSGCRFNGAAGSTAGSAGFSDVGGQSPSIRLAYWSVFVSWVREMLG